MRVVSPTCKPTFCRRLFPAGWQIGNISGLIMPKPQRSLRTDLDWYLISVDRLRQIAVVLVLALIGFGVWYYFAKFRQDPRVQASSAISSAQAAINELAASPGIEDFRAEYDQARSRLEQARAELAATRFDPARAAAIESESIARSALARQGGGRDADAQFLSVEGEVLFQKAGGEWKRADSRTPLYNGDWVKTGSGASAELIFSNGTLYTVGPDALLEIYATVNPQTSNRQNAVQMQVGSVEINTTDEVSTVRTPSTQVVVSSASTAQVGVDGADRSTRILALKGSSSVSPASGGEAVSLAAGEQVAASGTGVLGGKSAFLPPPALQQPADNFVIRAGSTPRVEFSWNQVDGARGYRLQVSRSRLFPAPEIDAIRETTSAAAEATGEGLFYWRVATVGPDGTIGPFSPFRRFRVAGSSATPGTADRTPPTLQLSRPFNIGGAYYMIEGQVEPGATVFVNDEEVDVGADGAFKKLVSFTQVGWNTVIVKAVDPAGNETVQRERVQVKD